MTFKKICLKCESIIFLFKKLLQDFGVLLYPNTFFTDFGDGIIKYTKFCINHATALNLSSQFPVNDCLCLPFIRVSNYLIELKMAYIFLKLVKIKISQHHLILFLQHL